MVSLNFITMKYFLGVKQIYPICKSNEFDICSGFDPDKYELRFQITHFPFAFCLLFLFFILRPLWIKVIASPASDILCNLGRVTRPCSELGHKDLSEWSQRYKHADRQGECERGLQINRNLKKNTNKQTDKREMVRYKE